MPDWEHRACADPDRVTRYWPSASHNVGIACGPSGLVVVDLDTSPDDAPGQMETIAPYGAVRLAEVCRQSGQEWPHTLTVSTPHGGWHLFFRAGAGREIRNSASKIAPKVDVRGSGGFVVGPGSVVGGRSYRITEDRPPVILPSWLADLAAPPPVPPAPRPVVPLRPADGYAAAAVRAEIGAVIAAAPGTRNDELNRSAFNLGQLVAAGMLDEDQVAEALRRAADRNGLLADDGIRQCEATIRSGLRAGMANPRQGVA